MYPAAYANATYARRKRARAGTTVTTTVVKKPKGRERGFLRTGGFYGRFSGPDAEMKFFDTAVSFNIDATGEVPATGQWNLIPQGVTESTRVGRKCVLTSIHFRGTALYSPGAAAIACDAAYIYVVLDKQANGAAAAITDVLTSNNIAVSMVNLANSERFRILKKIPLVFNTGAGVTTAYAPMIKKIEFFKKCHIPLEFSSTTGAITELKSNNVFILAGTATASDDLINVVGTCRVRFSDGS